MSAITDIIEHKRVVFSRWGDGEWTAILRLRPGTANADGHHYFEDMGVELARVLESRPKYTLGLQPFVRRTMMDVVGPWLEKRGLSFDWDNADRFHRAAQAGDWTFLSRFKELKYTYVGPAHLKSVFSGGKFIQIPEKDCWTITDSIVRSIISEMTDVVGFSAGMPANVWIDRIHKERPEATLVDFGSVFDPLAGVNSRGYMRK